MHLCHRSFQFEKHCWNVFLSMVLNSLRDFAFILYLLLKNFVILVFEVRVTVVVELQSSTLLKFHAPNYYGFCGYGFVLDCATIV